MCRYVKFYEVIYVTVNKSRIRRLLYSCREMCSSGVPHPISVGLSSSRQGNCEMKLQVEREVPSTQERCSDGWGRRSEIDLVGGEVNLDIQGHPCSPRVTDSG